MVFIVNWIESVRPVRLCPVLFAAPDRVLLAPVTAAFPSYHSSSRVPLAL